MKSLIKIIGLVVIGLAEMAVLISAGIYIFK